MKSLAADLVVFDLDGTLVDTAPDLGMALNHALDELGRSPVPLREVRHLAGKGARALLRRGLQLSGGASAKLIERGVAPFLRYYEAHICDYSQFATGAAEAIIDLERAGVAIGICTNKPERMAKKLLGQLGWATRFGSIVGGDTTAACKPDPRPLLYCVQECGGSRPAFVGDSLIDLVTAKAAGIPFVALASEIGACTFEAGYGGLVIHSFGELLTVLTREE